MVVLATLALLSSVTTIGGLAAPVTLSVWNSDATPEVLDWYKSVLVPAFEKTHPGVTVEVIKTPWGKNYTDKIVTAYAAGVGPDIIYGGAEYVDGFVENGFVLPIDEQVSKWTDWKDFIPPTLGAVTYKKHTYGVPVFLDFRTMLISPQLFLSSGLDPAKPPVTWEDFTKVGKRLTRFSGEKLEVAGLNIATNYDTFNQAVWQAGGEILNEDKTAAAFNSPTGLAALKFMVETTRETLNGATISGFPNLINGKLGMIYQASPARFAAAAIAAGVSEEDLGASVVPPLKQKAAVAGVFSNWMGIGSQSKNRDLAWEFLKFHMDTRNYTEFCAINKSVPTRMSLIRSDYAKNSPWLIKSLTYASTYGKATWTAVDFAGLRDSLNPELAKAMQGTITPEAALEGVARIWNNILSVKR
jgi:multiple sugar transport system substrate-binding protein